MLNLKNPKVITIILLSVTFLLGLIAVVLAVAVNKKSTDTRSQAAGSTFCRTGQEKQSWCDGIVKYDVYCKTEVKCNESPGNCEVRNARCVATAATPTPPATGLPTCNGSQAAGQCKCGVNTCQSGNMICNPENSNECISACNGTTNRCHCNGNMCLAGVQGTGNFTCGANGSTCTSSSDGWPVGAVCRYKTGGGSCARAEFKGSCNPGVGKMCFCNGGTATQKSDGYTYHTAVTTGGFACASNGDNSSLCNNRYGLINGDGTTCGNTYRCANAPTVSNTSTPIPTIPVNTTTPTKASTATPTTPKSTNTPTSHQQTPTATAVSLPTAKCLQLSLSAGPYTAGTTPTITVKTSGTNNANYRYKIDMVGGTNTGNYNYTQTKYQTNVTDIKTDSFISLPLVQTDNTLPATYTVSLSDVRTTADNTTLTNTNVCKTSFTMLQTGYTVSKVALSSDGTTMISSIEPGQTFKYQVQVQNTASLDVNNITVTDTFDSTFISKFTLSNASNSGVISGNTVTWSGVNLNAGNSYIQLLTFDATVKSDFFTGSNNCSEEVINNVSALPNTVNTPDTIKVNVNRPNCTPDFTITKVASPQVASPSTQITYNAVITNNSSISQPILKIGDTFSVGFSYITGSAVFTTKDGTNISKDPTVDGNKLTWQFADSEAVTLNPGDVLKLTYKMKASSSVGDYPNTICLELPAGDKAVCATANVKISTTPITGLNSKNSILYLAITGTLIATAGIIVRKRYK